MTARHVTRTAVTMLCDVPATPLTLPSLSPLTAFPSPCRHVCSTPVGCYVMSLRRHSSATSFRFNSEIMAARKMILDLETFQTFFDSYSDELRRGGLRPKGTNPGK